MAKGYVIRGFAEWLVIALVLGALFLEWLLHKFEGWALRRYPHVQVILRNLYREVMIMGLVSFGFIIFNISGERDKNTLLTFEVAHLFMFLFSVFNIIVVTTAVFISLSLSRHWKRFERLKLTEYKDHKERYSTLKAHRIQNNNKFWRSIGWWITKPWTYCQYHESHEIVLFHDIRWQFIHYRNLAMDFQLSSFLRRVKSATFISLVDGHALNWFILLALVATDIVRGMMYTRGIIRNPVNFDAIALIVFSAVNIFFATALAWKIRWVYWKLNENPALYFENVAPLPSDEASDAEQSPPADLAFPPQELQHQHPNPSEELYLHPPIYSTMVRAPELHNTRSVSPNRHSLDMTKVPGMKACFLDASHRNAPLQRRSRSAPTAAEMLQTNDLSACSDIWVATRTLAPV